jgi:hypothetical protein
MRLFGELVHLCNAESPCNYNRPSFLNVKLMRIETYSRQRDPMFQANDFRVGD